MRVGLIGFGAIGQQVARGVRDTGDELVAVLVRQPRAPGGVPFVEHVAELLARRPEVVVEAAGRAALQAYGEVVAQSGATLISGSAAALLDEAFRARLVAACEGAGRRAYFPSGALGGLDALGAAALGELEAVRVRVVQPGWAARTLFRGDAVAATARFPDGLNVAAAAALVAQRPVEVELAEAPGGRRLELYAKGAFGEFRSELSVPAAGVPEAHIVALSLLAALRRLGAPIVVG